MLRTRYLSFAISLILLSGCSATELASSAADAAACRAAESSLAGLSEAYRAGLVDSGVIAQIDSLVGNQVRQLLSTGLAKDFEELGKTISQSDPGASTAQKIAELTQDIATRCQAVGVDLGK